MAHSKALIISNPFKGTLSSLRIGEIVKEELIKKITDEIQKNEKKEKY